MNDENTNCCGNKNIGFTFSPVFPCVLNLCFINRFCAFSYCLERNNVCMYSNSAFIFRVIYSAFNRKRKLKSILRQQVSRDDGDDLLFPDRGGTKPHGENDKSSGELSQLTQSLRRTSSLDSYQNVAVEKQEHGSGWMFSFAWVPHCTSILSPEPVFCFLSAVHKIYYWKRFERPWK